MKRDCLKNKQNKNRKQDRKKPNNPTEPIEVKKYVKLTLLLTSIFAILIILISNVFIVKENEYRVVSQFGQIKRLIQDPGINMKIPFIQTVMTLPKNQMTNNVSEEEITTKDKKRIMIDNYAVWKITNPRDNDF